MPAGNRTGPLGYGPMTGRGLGYCAGYSAPGFTKGTPRGGMGYGFGRGRGFGRGFGRRFYPDISYGYSMSSRETYPEYYYYPPVENISQEQRREEEKVYLENLVKHMGDEIRAMQERLKELSEEKEQE